MRKLCFLGFALLTLGGCGPTTWMVEVTPEPVATSKSKDTSDNQAAEQAAPNSSPDAPSNTIPPGLPGPIPGMPSKPKVAVLLSADIPAYQGIATRLKSEMGGRVTVHNLRNTELGAHQAMLAIKSSKVQQVVAVGLHAARAARRLTGQQVVFCQVFNYQDHDLISSTMKGVSLVPSMQQQFVAWRSLDPDLRKVAVITGNNQDQIIAQARATATQYGIHISHHQVTSDKEALYTFKQIAHTVQGLWLLPDNRVLSRRVLRELLTFSIKNGKQVVVFNPQMLKLGALMSVSSSVEDIVRRVLERLAAGEAKPEIPGPEVMPLQSVKININAKVAQGLGLSVPASLRQYVQQQP